MKQIHLIANAHLDPVWLWRWEEGCSEALSTFRTAVELIDKYPNFTFNHNESILYKWVEENDPELFADILRLVKEGRWNITGGWYLQPDCNMPCGESFIRNILTGRKYFGEKFGVRPTTAVNYDSFGHTKGLVQIIKKSGFDSYVVYRGGQSHQFKEHDLIWRGLDESQIIVHRSDEGYNSVYGHAADKLKKYLEKNTDEQLSFFLWGVGDHGGGPTREDLDKLAQMREEYKDSVEIIHSTPEEYIKTLKASGIPMPETDLGLNYLCEGCYSDQIKIKQKHRLLEAELYSAETMLSAAQMQYGLEYPKDKLDEAKDDLLFAEFHDALPGTGTAEVEEDTLRLLDHGLEIVAREKMRAFLALAAGQERIIDGTSTFFIYNHHPFEIEGEFICEMGLPKQNWEHNFMYPQVRVNGEVIPTQAEKECSNFGIDWRKRVAVHAKLAPSSMNRFDVYWTPIEKRPEFEPIAGKKYFEFDNGEMQVKINTSTGLIDSYTVGGREFLGASSGALAAYDDGNNPWGMRSHTCGRRQFALLYPSEGSEFSGLKNKIIPSVRMIEDGQVRTVIEAVFGLHNSRAYQRYILPKKGTSFEIECGVDWSEKEQYLKMELNTGDGDFAGQITFGRENLPKEREVTYHKWISLTSDGGTVAVINNGIYGGSLKKGVMGLTLLRSPAYTASNDNTGEAMRELRYAPRMCQGMHIYNFKITAGNAEAISADIDRMALCFNEKPYTLAHIPSGKGTAPGRLIELDNTSVMLSCFKPAEDGNGYIIRLYEAQGEACCATLKLPMAGVERKLDFTKFEVKTLRLTKDNTLVDEEMCEGY